MPRKKQCTLCSRWCSNFRSISSSSHEWFHQYLHSNGTVFDENDLNLCSACVCKFYSEREATNILAIPESMDTTEEVNVNTNDQLTLQNVIFAGSGHKYCVVCGEEVRGGAMIMPKGAQFDLLIYNSMYAPDGVRYCSSHLLNKKRLKPNANIIMENPMQRASCLSSSKMIDLVADLLSLLQEVINAPRLDLLEFSLNEEDYLAWTGWTKQQFDHMYDIISPNLRSSSNRHIRNTLAIFWIKLKTNLSFRQIDSMFNVPENGEDRRKRPADAFDSVRQCVIEKFVPHH